MNVHKAHFMCINAQMSSAITHNDILCTTSYKTDMDENEYIDRIQVIEFLDDAKRITGKSISRIATDARVSHTTVTRYYNNDEPDHEIKRVTLNKIAKSIGFISYSDYIAQKTMNPDVAVKHIHTLTNEQLTECVFKLQNQMKSIVRHLALVSRKNRVEAKAKSDV